MNANYDNNIYVYFWSKLGVKFVDTSKSSEPGDHICKFEDQLKVMCFNVKKFSFEFCAKYIWQYFRNVECIFKDSLFLWTEYSIKGIEFVNLFPSESWRKLYIDYIKHLDMPEELTSKEEVDLLLTLNGIIKEA